MTIRLFCVATSKSDTPIIAQMQQIAGEDLTIALQLGGTDAAFKGTSLSRMNRKRGTVGHLMDHDRYRGAAQALFRQPRYLQAMEEFITHLERRNENNDLRPHRIHAMQEYSDYFHILADAMAAKIRESGATHALFFNVPHLAYDSIAFQVARAMGLPTLVLTQSLFPAQYFSMGDPADLGAFAPRDDAPRYPIDKQAQLDLFYMKDVKQEPSPRGRVSARAMLNLAAFLITRRPRAALNPAYLRRILLRMQAIYGGLPNWRDPFAKFFHDSQLDYFDHLVEHETAPVDLSTPYVYMPLQLQPEMTTASLGGIYTDQALAIERLADMLPEGVRILVKENPKQGAYMRGPMFFHRLKRIPQVHFLPSFADTHALTANAQFVATVTGTVGWEAVRLGKPVLTFGRAWYRSFPGVVEYRDGLEYAEVAQLTWEHAALERAVGDLLSRCHGGIIERHYRKMVADHDPEENAAQVARSILDLLSGRAVPTFGSMGVQGSSDAPGAL
ncbi:capsular polysaccharide export protein, LipB/KpsS family [Roseicitreum antarcticum]|uniref:Capsule polysaccharide biosynthesis protein n=1 Tax=Roseicitreum antarcticum TaxID=564137 RepID=A0A1H3CIH6_9RHOB|nr:hypothetical protein [Roseicitreum antarcticum]SDX54042.1 Capsule polysaccharide biosynthesis protein [Roseicitreum antarcticum]